MNCKEHFNHGLRLFIFSLPVVTAAYSFRASSAGLPSEDPWKKVISDHPDFQVLKSEIFNDLLKL